MFFTRDERIETLRACRDCPMCHHIDTVAAITGKETNTPRGRGMTLWGIEKGILSWKDDGVSDILYKALLDGLAQEWCDGNYDHDELVIDGRSRLVTMGKVPPEVAHLTENIRNTGNPYGVREEEVKSLVEKGGGSVGGNPEVAFFFGSSARIHRPEIILSMVKILRSLQIPFEILDRESDSGFLLYQCGDFQAATEQSKQIAAMLMQAKSKKLVLLGAADYRMFTTRYSRFGASLPPQMVVMHVTQFLAQLLKEGRLIFKKTFPDKVTYHDPCSLGRFTYVVEPPRELLSALAGKNFVEMQWSGKRAHCCGGSGGLPFTYPEISEKVSRLRIEEALQTGARVLASACPECEQMLSRVVQPDEMEVKDIVELIGEAL